MAKMPTSSDLCQRLLKEGASKLSNSELVAILLETTPSGEKMMTLNLSRRLLKYNDELRLVEGVVRDWIQYMNEIKKTKEAFLKASLEVQKRGLTDVLKNYNAVLYPYVPRNDLMSERSFGTGSVLSGLFVNQQHQMLGFDNLFSGSIDDITNLCHQNTILEEIGRIAKRYSATKVIVVCQHLSLDTSPTPADISFLLWLQNRLRFTGVLLLDSWIIGDNSII